MQAAPIPMQTEPIHFPDPALVKDKDVVIDTEPKLSKHRELSPSHPPVISSTVSALSPLEELASADCLLITKRLRVRGVLALKGKRNRFFIKTPDQRMIYTVEEENSWWVGYLCYGLRRMELKVSNREGQEIMRIERPYACTARILPCQLQRLKVYAPPGHPVGTVEQAWTPLKPQYIVKNVSGERVFFIYGPYITISCFSDVNFSITKPDGTPVGGTCKRWLGVTHAVFFSPITDKFSVTFDSNLSLEEKALLLAATLLLDYMYYDA